MVAEEQVRVPERAAASSLQPGYRTRLPTKRVTPKGLLRVGAGPLGAAAAPGAAPPGAAAAGGCAVLSGAGDEHPAAVHAIATASSPTLTTINCGKLCFTSPIIGPFHALKLYQKTRCSPVGFFLRIVR